MLAIEILDPQVQPRSIRINKGNVLIALSEFQMTTSY